MLKTKIFEIRDQGTFIVAIATKMKAVDPAEDYLLQRAGYEHNDPTSVLFSRVDGGCYAEYNPYSWRGGRSMREAHKYIEEYFENLESGSVIDIEYILGETSKPKKSENLQSI